MATKKNQPMTAKRFRSMSKSARVTWLTSVPVCDVHDISIPCIGEAHRNANMDMCPVCLGFSWGRMLPPGGLEPSEIPADDCASLLSDVLKGIVLYAESVRDRGCGRAFYGSTGDLERMGLFEYVENGGNITPKGTAVAKLLADRIVRRP